MISSYYYYFNFEYPICKFKANPTPPPEMTCLGLGKLKDYRLDFYTSSSLPTSGKLSFAIITPSPGDYVLGYIYAIHISETENFQMYSRDNVDLIEEMNVIVLHEEEDRFYSCITYCINTNLLAPDWYNVLPTATSMELLKAMLPVSGIPQVAINKLRDAARKYAGLN